MLLLLGCEQGQGYRYGKAVGAPLFARLLSEQAKLQRAI
jgi:hypothetical protein